MSSYKKKHTAHTHSHYIYVYALYVQCSEKNEQEKWMVKLTKLAKCNVSTAYLHLGVFYYKYNNVKLQCVYIVLANKKGNCILYLQTYLALWKRNIWRTPIFRILTLQCWFFPTSCYLQKIMLSWLDCTTNSITV